MTLDWKEISQSEGYRSLKAAYTLDVQDCNKEVQKGWRPMRRKPEFFKHFQWVISRAMHYAYHQSKTVGQVLTEWEAKRDYWWLNYYQECRQPWLVKSPYVRYKSLKTHLKEDIHRVRNAPNAASHIARIKKHYKIITIREQKEQSKRQGNKARWPKNDWRRSKRSP